MRGAEPQEYSLYFKVWRHSRRRWIEREAGSKSLGQSTSTLSRSAAQRERGLDPGEPREHDLALRAPAGTARLRDRLDARGAELVGLFGFVQLAIADGLQAQGGAQQAGGVLTVERDARA